MNCSRCYKTFEKYAKFRKPFPIDQNAARATHHRRRWAGNFWLFGRNSFLVLFLRGRTRKKLAKREIKFDFGPHVDIIFIVFPLSFPALWFFIKNTASRRRHREGEQSWQCGWGDVVMGMWMWMKTSPSSGNYLLLLLSLLFSLFFRQFLYAPFGCTQSKAKRSGTKVMSTRHGFLLGTKIIFSLLSLSACVPLCVCVCQ